MKKKRTFLVFVSSFAVSLILALACGYFFLDHMRKKKETVRESRLRECIDLVIEETRNEYNQRSETGECSTYRIENALRGAIREEDIYVSVYIDRQLVAHTYRMTPIRLEYEGVCYNLESADNLKEIDDFANGMYSICKSADLARKYKYDPIGLRFFLQKDICLYSVDEAWINTKTRTFVPGCIEVYPASTGNIISDTGVNAKKESLWARIKLVPEGKNVNGTWDYVYDILALDKGRCLFSCEDCRDPSLRTLADADREYYAFKDENTGEIVEVETDYDDTDHDALWSVTFTSKLEPMSILEMFPLLFWAVIAVAVLLAMIPSSVISLIFHVRRKIHATISDYRKRTTEEMAHDLKTPLAAISGYSELLEENWTTEPAEMRPGSHVETDEKKEEENLKYVRKIRENVMELNRIVEGILFFSKMDGRNGNPVSEPTNLRRLVEESVKKSEYQLNQRGLTVDVIGGSSYWNTDPDVLSLVCNNLISNCARYADPESEVKIRLSDKEIEFKNRYSGKIENVDDLRRPFVKGDAARGEEGTGLGLAIVDNDLKLLGLGFKLECKGGFFVATIVKK